MHSLSSLLSHKGSHQSANLTLYGPTSQGILSALNATHQEVARFTWTNGVLCRDSQQICTFKYSSLSGTTTMHVHGREVKVKQSWEGMQNGKDIKAPNGTMHWRRGSGGFQELRDGREVVARGKLGGGLGGKEPYLEMFLSADDFTMDLIISSWVAILLSQKSEGEQLEVLGEVVGAIAGS
jgi:hypothetical protein